MHVSGLGLRSAVFNSPLDPGWGLPLWELPSGGERAFTKSAPPRRACQAYQQHWFPPWFIIHVWVSLCHAHTFRRMVHTSHLRVSATRANSFTNWRFLRLRVPTAYLSYSILYFNQPFSFSRLFRDFDRFESRISLNPPRKPWTGAPPVGAAFRW